MSVDYVRGKNNSNALSVAQRQQRQISYFTQSCVQEEITQEYMTQWANRNYAGTDYFLTWVKMIFRTDNFLSFFKYLRHPLPSAALVNDNIVLQLKRVFVSEDAYFRYVISGKEVPTPDVLNNKEFVEEAFNALLFRYNDIIFTDLKAVNTPHRHLVCIDNVVAIDSERNIIKKIAFAGKITLDNGEHVHGYVYADKERYIFYNNKYEIVKDVPHDLGECPADYVSQEPFSQQNNPYLNNTLSYSNRDVVRKSIFSYAREDLEEYVFLKTLLKMTEPNGAIPVVTKLKTTEVTKDGKDIKGISDKEPMASNTIGGQQARTGSEVNGSSSPLQTGSIIDVPVMKDANGEINMDIVNNFINFYHIPTECLTYVKDRIKELKGSIIASVLGDYSEADEDAKNELQISKSFVSKEDKLRYMSNSLSAVVTKSDRKMLGLKYGIGRIETESFFGSDFFTESQEYLYNLFAKSPNQIESKNILIRLSKNRNLYNRTKAKRERILYDLLPFANNADFNTALGQQILSPQVVALQLQFTYWIGIFEATYGDILVFWDAMGEEKDSVKLVLINNLLKQIINESELISTPPSVPGQGAAA
jgi:hypothetical protein